MHINSELVQAIKARRAQTAHIDYPWKDEDILAGHSEVMAEASEPSTTLERRVEIADLIAFKCGTGPLWAAACWLESCRKAHSWPSPQKKPIQDGIKKARVDGGGSWSDAVAVSAEAA